MAASMRPVRCFSIFFISLAFFLTSTQALFEDQVGKFDWKREYIGKPLAFQILPVSRKIIVATEAHVLASLVPRNGDIGWRQIQEKDELGCIDLLTGNDDHIVTVSNDGGIVRSWDVNNGYLKSESIISTSGAENVLESYHHLLLDDWKLIRIDVVSDATVVLSVFNATTGTLTRSQKIPYAWNHKTTNCSFTSASRFSCVDTSTNYLHTLNLDDDLSFLVIPILTVIPNPVQVRSIVPLPGITTKHHSYVALELETSELIILNLESESAKLVAIDHKIVSADVIETSDGLTLLAVRKGQKTSQLQFYVKNLETGKELEQAMSDVQLPSDHGKPLQVWAYSVPRKEGGFAYRVLLVFEDHSIVLVQNSGKVLWTREESLASIINVEMVDLPLSESDAQFEQEFRTGNANIFSMLVKRITTQLLQLETILISVLSGLQPKDTKGANTGNALQLTRDEFNLHKIILVVTKPGKIFGVDSLTGQIIWHRFIPKMKPFKGRDGEQLVLFIQRTTAYFPHHPQGVVVGKNEITGKGLIYPFHPISGMPLTDGSIQLDFEIAQVLLLPQADDQYLRPIVFLDVEKNVHVYPESGLDIARSISKSLFVFTAEVDTGIVTGYSLAYSKEKQKLVATVAWEMNFPLSTQTITHVVLKRQMEHVHSQGRVMGDRSVLYKYLNPNLAAILTKGFDAQQKPFFNIFLLDAVTGNIVYSATHKRCRGPVYVVHSENWIVYAYHSEKSRRSEMAVLELYEGKWQSNSTAFSSLHPPQSPMVERQAYIFPPGLNAAAVTITEKGITSKLLLFALPSGGILELPKSLLDPRRPLIPTQEHREEGIYPYTPELPIPSENVINYNQSIQNVRGIYTSPAGLESTCLVLAYGLDLFYTRVTPSRTFDVLKDDFDHYLISLMLLALIFASYLTRRLAARKALHQAWK